MAGKANDYGAQSITVLEGLEPVRTRPGMYIGGVGRKGLNHLVYEILDNAVDEHLAGHCSRIDVTLGADGSATIRDDGRGVPVGMHAKGVSAERVVFTTLHAGGKFDGASYKTSGGLHGVGSSVVNALSERFSVTIRRDGWEWHDEYSKGRPVVELKDGMPRKVRRTKETGTEISFKPDLSVFEADSFSADDVRERIRETAYLNPGLTIHLLDETRSPAFEADFHEPEGVAGFVRDLDEGLEAECEPFVMRGESGGIEVECAVQYTTEFHENVLGFCNCISNPDGGTHVTGFKSAFTSVINAYARELGTLKDKDANFTGADVRCGMTAVVSVKHPDPRFEGQTKTKLDNQDAAKAVSAVVTEQSRLFLDRNLEVLKRIIARAERSAKVRAAEEKAKTNALSTKKYSFDGNGKLANCESRNPAECEIFIVEGDSAGGSAKMARDRRTQAIMPIRGKILNVEKASLDKALANAEIRAMISAFGCGFSEGYGADFDASKLNYGKIVIMADADVDGAHISTLLLTLFWRFMPELITDGHVYVAMPPLYKATPSRGEPEYLYDDAALARYRRSHSNFALQRYKGLGEMDPEQLWETTLDPARRYLKRVNVDDATRASRVTELLMGSRVEPRKAFIHERAQSAEVDA